MSICKPRWASASVIATVFVACADPQLAEPAASSAETSGTSAISTSATGSADSNDGSDSQGGQTAGNDGPSGTADDTSAGDDAPADGSDEDTGSGPGPALPACTDLPAWVPPLWEWAPISTNTIADVDPSDSPETNANFPEAPTYHSCNGLGQASVIDVWNGGVFASNLRPRGSMLVWGGGHNGWRGNEVYLFDVEARAWERATDPFDSPSIPANSGTPGTYPRGRFPDGSPVPSHTYNGIAWHPPTHSFVVPNGASGQCLSGSQAAGGAMLAFSSGETYDDGSWRPLSVEGRPAGYPYMSTVYDPTREVLWTISQAGPLGRLDPTAGPDGNGEYGEWTGYGNNWGIGLDQSAAIDPVHDLLVVFNPSGTVLARSLAEPESPHVSIVLDGDQSPRLGKGGVDYVPELGALVWYGGEGSEMIAVSVPEGDWRTEPWPSMALPYNGGEFQTDGGTNGVYGRVRYVPSIGSMITVGDVEEPVYAYRIACR